MQFFWPQFQKRAGVILQRTKTAAPYTVDLIYQLTVGMQIAFIYIFGYQLVNQTLRTNKKGGIEHYRGGMDRRVEVIEKR